MDTKYGRIFTEQDVVKIIRQTSEQPAGFTDDEAKEFLADFEGKFPKDEPVFVLRAKDVCALDAIDYYKLFCEREGAGQDHLSAVDEAIDRFNDYAASHATKIPD